MTKKTRLSYNYNRTLDNWLGAGVFPALPDGAEVGVEIEVEGAGLPGAIKNWQVVPDGSLRGESAEYIFRGPAPRSEVAARLTAFQKAMAGVQVNESYRTSVHVHLNARDMQIKNILNQIILYTIFEDVLGEFCGSERVGNLFCLRAKDAEYYIEQLLRVVREDSINILNQNEIRYTACNPVALFRHGTLEFRSFRGTVDVDLIEQWVGILLAIKDAARDKFENPIQIVQGFSSDGPDGFARRIFTEEQIGLFNRGWQDKLMANVRLVQHVAHACDWSPTPEKTAKKLNPPTYGQYVAGTTDVDVAAMARAVQAAEERIRLRAMDGANIIFGRDPGARPVAVAPVVQFDEGEEI